jgi:hypothetical protein
VSLLPRPLPRPPTGFGSTYTNIDGTPSQNSSPPPSHALVFDPRDVFFQGGGEKRVGDLDSWVKFYTVGFAIKKSFEGQLEEVENTKSVSYLQYSFGAWILLGF